MMLQRTHLNKPRLMLMSILVLALLLVSTRGKNLIAKGHFLSNAEYSLTDYLSHQQVNEKDFSVIGQIRSTAFIEENFVWLVTLAGDLWRTQNGGISWEKLSSESDRQFICISFINKDQGWAVSKDAFMLYTHNGGKQWQKYAQLNYPEPGIVADKIHFIDNLHGWIAGSLHYLWRTEDGGRNWALVSGWQDGICTIHRMRFYSPKVGWLACHYGLLFRTEDGGRNWKAVEVKSNGGVINDVFFVNRMGWVAGYSDVNIYKTTDGGTHWKLHFPFKHIYGSGDIESLFFLKEKQGWAVGEDKPANSRGLKGIVLYTGNGGKNWRPVKVASKMTICYWVFFANKNKGWVIDTDTVYATRDGGKTWKEVWSMRNL